MGGGLIQLVAYGSQNVYLNCNPEITFFKVVYKKHTNFSIESIRQNFTGSLTNGQKAVSTINRSGDLLSKLYLEFNPRLILQSGNNNGWSASNIGHTLFKKIDVEIGGQTIDTHYGHWLTTYQSLNMKNPSNKRGNYGANTGAEPTRGNSTLYDYMSYNHLKINHGAGATSFSTTAPNKALVPLQFWFCRNIGLALPLIALQYHEVKISLEFCDKEDLFENIDTGNISIGDVNLWADYIFLDTEERRKFADISHEYLIEQLQMDESENSNYHELDFNHPVKELIWIGKPKTPSITGNGGGTPMPLNIDGKWNIIFNNVSRFSPRPLKYFTHAQVYQHHQGNSNQGIAVYSFSINPKDNQPSGTCNFSRIDKVELNCDITNQELIIYAVNYNILRIMNGTGGLAFAN